MKLHSDDGKILNVIYAKSFEDKEVQENAQRNKTQVVIEKKWVCELYWNCQDRSR